MRVLYFLFYIIIDIISNLKNKWNNAKLCANNRTIRIDSTSIIGNSSLGNFVRIFDNVLVYNAMIDEYSYIQKDSKIYNCNIGKFCSIGSNVCIAPGIHDYTKVSTHPSFVFKSCPLPITFAHNDKIVSNKRVIIGNDVWIGEGAIILDGVTIGNGAIIGAGAIVTKDVLPYSIMVGIPAKLLKGGF